MLCNCAVIANLDNLDSDRLCLQHVISVTSILSFSFFSLSLGHTRFGLDFNTVSKSR